MYFILRTIYHLNARRISIQTSWRKRTHILIPRPANKRLSGLEDLSTFSVQWTRTTTSFICTEWYWEGTHTQQNVIEMVENQYYQSPVPSITHCIFVCLLFFFCSPLWPTKFQLCLPFCLQFLVYIFQLSHFGIIAFWIHTIMLWNNFHREKGLQVPPPSPPPPVHWSP